MRVAILVEHRAAAYAQVGLQRAARVIKTRVDHLAIARTRADPDRFARLEHDHLATAGGHRPRDGESDHASANHHTFDSVHLTILGQPAELAQVLYCALLHDSP